MAKYITVICKVKGETILKLNNDLFNSYPNQMNDNNNEYKNGNQYISEIMNNEISDEEKQTDDQFIDNTDLFIKLDQNDKQESSENYSIVKSKSGKMLNVCQYKNCRYSSISTQSVINHIRIVHLNLKSFKCHFSGCGKSFSYKRNLHNHYRVHYGRNGSEIESNIETVSKSDNENCSDYRTNDFDVISDAVTDTDSDFDAKVPQHESHGESLHQNVQMEENSRKRLKVDLNDSEVISGIESVEQYVKMVKIDGKLWRSCQISGCNYGSNSAASIVHHIRMHLNYRPFKCNFSGCDKAFTIVSNLNNHKKTHKNLVLKLK